MCADGLDADILARQNYPILVLVADIECLCRSVVLEASPVYERHIANIWTLANVDLEFPNIARMRSAVLAERDLTYRGREPAIISLIVASLIESHQGRDGRKIARLAKRRMSHCLSLAGLDSLEVFTMAGLLVLRPAFLV